MIFDFLSPQEIVLVIITLYCIYTDLRWRKIFNYVTFPGIILGLGLNLIMHGASGLAIAFLGMLTGGAIIFLMYLAGGVGAGDVKYLAASGALMGPSFIFRATLYGIIGGGIFVVLYMLFSGRLKRLIVDTADIFRRTIMMKKLDVTSFETDRLYIPYGVFLGIGVLVHLVEIKGIINI
ncbi:MAG: hypothetical protein GX817_03080 [Elusimicrobia bacterium]|nr:hypothetical protein [Elusimicrobiota bacterium]